MIDVQFGHHLVNKSTAEQWLSPSGFGVVSLVGFLEGMAAFILNATKAHRHFILEALTGQGGNDYRKGQARGWASSASPYWRNDTSVRKPACAFCM